MHSYNVNIWDINFNINQSDIIDHWMLFSEILNRWISNILLVKQVFP
jgi:hypothetical protein